MLFHNPQRDDPGQFWAILHGNLPDPEPENDLQKAPQDQLFHGAHPQELASGANSR